MNPILFTKRLELTDKLDFQTGLGREALGMGADLLAQRLGPLAVIEQANVAFTEVAGHRLGVADLREGAGDDDPVEARQHTADLIVMLFNKGVHRLTPVCWPTQTMDDPPLFGSGFAGLGVTLSSAALKPSRLPWRM